MPCAFAWKLWRIFPTPIMHLSSLFQHQNVPMVMGHHEVSLGQRTKTPKCIFKRSFIADKKYHLSMMAAIKEVTFSIKLAYEYNGLSMKLDVNIMHVGNNMTVYKASVTVFIFK